MRKSLSLLPLLLGSLGLAPAPGVTLAPQAPARPFDRGGNAPAPKRQPRVTGISSREDWVLARFRNQPVPPSRPTRQSQRHAGRQAVKAARWQDGQHPALDETRGVGKAVLTGARDWSGSGWRGYAQPVTIGVNSYGNLYRIL